MDCQEKRGAFKLSSELAIHNALAARNYQYSEAG
jgi:hypothetical protein